MNTLDWKLHSIYVVPNFKTVFVEEDWLRARIERAELDHLRQGNPWRNFNEFQIK